MSKLFILVHGTGLLDSHATEGDNPSAWPASLTDEQVAEYARAAGTLVAKVEHDTLPATWRDMDKLDDRFTEAADVVRAVENGISLLPAWGKTLYFSTIQAQKVFRYS